MAIYLMEAAKVENGKEVKTYTRWVSADSIHEARTLFVERLKGLGLWNVVAEPLGDRPYCPSETIGEVQE